MKRSNRYITAWGLFAAFLILCLWLVSCNLGTENADEYPTGTSNPTEPAILTQGTSLLTSILYSNFTAASCFDLDKGIHTNNTHQTDFCFNAFSAEDEFVFFAFSPLLDALGYFLDDAPADYATCLEHLPDFTTDKIPNYTPDNIPPFPDSPNICILTNANHLALIQAGEVKQVSNTVYEINIKYTTWDVIFTVPTATPTVSPIVGDLGWGDITGVVSNGLTGAPIEGAIVTCEHSSYTSPALCNTSTITDINGFFIFKNIFFHDTDRVILRVTASNYNPQFYEWDFFDQPGIYVNVPMLPTDYTPIIMCTPPLCAIGTNEVYFCPGECPGGCGTICATYTPSSIGGISPTPTPPTFPCVDCDLGPALDFFCPLASGSQEAADLLRPYGEVQEGNMGDHTCKYAVVFDGYGIYVYYINEATSELKFVVINPNILTPSPTIDPNSPTPYTPQPYATATDTPNLTP